MRIEPLEAAAKTDVSALYAAAIRRGDFERLLPRAGDIAFLGRNERDVPTHAAIVDDVDSEAGLSLLTHDGEKLVRIRVPRGEAHRTDRPRVAGGLELRGFSDPY